MFFLVVEMSVCPLEASVRERYQQQGPGKVLQPGNRWEKTKNQSDTLTHKCSVGGFTEKQSCMKQ